MESFSIIENSIDHLNQSLPLSYQKVNEEAISNLSDIDANQIHAVRSPLDLRNEARNLNNTITFSSLSNTIIKSDNENNESHDEDNANNNDQVDEEEEEEEENEEEEEEFDINSYIEKKKKEIKNEVKEEENDKSSSVDSDEIMGIITEQKSKNTDNTKINTNSSNGRTNSNNTNVSLTKNNVNKSFLNGNNNNCGGGTNSSFISFNKESKGKNILNTSECNTNKKDLKRLQTAFCYNSKIEETSSFKSTENFTILNKAASCIDKLIIKRDESKIEIESKTGRENCKLFFISIEKLFTIFKKTPINKKYREKFSNSYRQLYECENIMYLPEIFDSAQEGNECLTINGEDYNFTKEVIENGTKLYISCFDLMQAIRELYNHIKKEKISYSINTYKNNLFKCLKEFDRNWVDYEEKYINELMDITKSCRKLINNAINVERELTLYENKASIKGKCLFNNKEYDALREKFMQAISEINLSSFNEDEDDDDVKKELLIDILIISENILIKVTEIQSKRIRKLCEKIKNSFNDIRLLMRKYAENIDNVEPDLNKNEDLQEILVNMEVNWENGEKYLANNKHFKQLLFFSQMIDIIMEKYSHNHIAELIDSRDPSVFVTIPCVLILKMLDKEDEKIVLEYLPSIKEKDSECEKIFCFLNEFKNELYSKVKDSYLGYNLMEKIVLFENCEEYIEVEKEILKYVDKGSLDKFKKGLVNLSIHLQRNAPSDWNEFLDLAMEI